MIVVDSSVWIAHLRHFGRSSVRELRGFEAEGPGILVGDIVLLEVLRGARDEAHALRLEAWLRSFKVVRMLDDELAARGAQHYRALRARGVTIRKTVDVIIATFCIDRGHHLLHEDRDFDPFAEHLGLMVA